MLGFIPTERMAKTAIEIRIRQRVGVERAIACGAIGEGPAEASPSNCLIDACRVEFLTAGENPK
jgi:purine nucleoside phosphorylase